MDVEGDRVKRADSVRWLPAALNRGWIYRDRVSQVEEGLSVSAFYSARYRHSDSISWRRRLQAGEILHNGLPQQQELLLACGDQLAWHRPPWREEAVPALGPSLQDDGDLVVLDKPAGLPVLPAGGWLEHTVLRLLEHRHRCDPCGIPRPVHRLGRFTSGLLVCARRRRTRAWLSAALRESTRLGVTAAAEPSEPGLRKLYRALLPPQALPLKAGESMEIRTPIGRRHHPRLGWIWCAAHDGRPGDLPAFSTITLLERGPDCDLVCVAIGSGRPHQIRIHCAGIGAPLIGDSLYRPGGVADPVALPGDGGYRLQAWRLNLFRPDGEPLLLEVPRALERSDLAPPGSPPVLVPGA